MQLDAVGTSIQSGHDVEEDQLESTEVDGVVITPDEHEQNFLLADFNFMLSLGLSERLALEWTQPLRIVNVNATFREDGVVVGPFESIHHRDETLIGPGDGEVGFRMRLLAPTLGRPTTLDLFVGSSIPIGKTEENPFALGRQGLEHQHVQFGSGTIDPILGLEVSHGLGGLSVSGWTRGRTALYENTNGHKAGARIAGGVALGTRLGDSDWSVKLGPELYHEQPSVWRPGDEAVNSGRTDLIAAGGIAYGGGEGVGVHLLAKKPFTLRTEGGQLSIPVVVILGASGTFDLFGGHDHGHGHDHDHAHEHGAHGHDEHGHDEIAHGHDEHGHDHTASGVSATHTADVADVARGGTSFELSEAIAPGKITVIDFWAEWCVPCHDIDDLLRDLAAEHPKLAVRRAEVVDIDSPVAVEHLGGVKGLPVVWIFDRQGKPVARLDATTESQVAERLHELLNED